MKLISPTGKTALVIACVLAVLALAAILMTAAVAVAHPQANCYETSPSCDYVQVNTPGGGVKMIYVCE